MSKISKTAAASMKGGPAEMKKDPFDTNDKKIHELRVQRTNKLAVVRYDFIDALLEEYDKERAAVAHLGPSCAGLLKRAEEAEEKASELQKQLDGLRRTLSEAANTGDGSYRA